MPYYPEKQIVAMCEYFLVDPENGDFDTVGIFYIKHPTEGRIDINRFFKSSDDGWDEIDKAEYDERKKARKTNG